jgi:Asp-tRNA(Asn)/Glu-tRNA(Gln) amidotransferase A subunit family amidase
MRIDDKTAPYRPVLSAYSALVNQLAAPAVTLPLADAGPEPGHPPVAIQFIGPSWSEPFLLSLGEALEDAGVVAVTAPPVPEERPSPE